MVQTESQPALQTMLELGPAWLDSYLLQFEMGKPVPLNSMIGVFEVASFKARHEDSLEWAAIAVRAANLEATAGRASAGRDSTLFKLMQFRAGFIARRGASPGDPVLDPENILRWFASNLTLSLEAAKDKIGRWRDSSLPIDARLGLDELRELRRIKNGAFVLNTLVSSGVLSSDTPLKEWLDLREQMP